MSTAKPKRSQLSDKDRERQLLDALARARSENNAEGTIESLRALAQLMPKTAKYAHQLGDALRKAGDDGGAAQAYKAATIAYAQDGHQARAEAMARTLLSVDPQRTSILERIARQQRCEPELPKAQARSSMPAHVLALAAAAENGRTPQANAKPRGPSISMALARARRQWVAAGGSTRNRTNPSPAQTATRANRPKTPTQRPATVSPAQSTAASNPRRRSRVIEANAERIITCLRGVAVFSNLPTTTLAHLAARCRLRSSAPEQFVVRHGETSDGLFIIMEGTAKFIVPEGDALRDIRLKASEVFGESCILDANPRTADVVAVDNVKTVFIHREVLKSTFAEHPQVESALLALLSKRLLANLLLTSPLFRRFTPEQRLEIARKLELQHVSRSAVLHSGNATPRGLLIPLAGALELAVVDLSGATVRSRIAPGSIIGHIDLLGANSRADTTSVVVRAIHDSIYVKLSGPELTELTMTHPPFLEALALFEPSSSAQVDPPIMTAAS